MSVAATNVVLYAATPIDYQMALGVAAAAGIPVANVIGNFNTAWTQVQTGGALVIAVGRAALNALYYNPCNWTNPSTQAGGHTPFDTIQEPATVVPHAGFFENGAGYLAQDTYRLATMLAYYAVRGTNPPGLTNLPSPIAPTEVCDTRANSDVPCPC
jgi:hypothetical protein